MSALLFSFNGWAEDDFPIELTCENGSIVTFISIAEELEDSYFTILSGNYADRSSNKFDLHKDEKIRFKSQLILDTQISLVAKKSSRDPWQGIGSHWQSLKINRLSGTSTFNYATISVQDGNCYSGLKEYNERKF
tara:strand:- start:462 stop:866 length:405 start_codon:yes stop_codon:yes gene_type:complete